MEDDSIVVAILGYIGCGCRDYQCRFSLHNILGRLLYRPAVSTSVAYVGGVTASLPSKAHFGRLYFHHHCQFPTRASRYLNCLDFASLSHSNSAADWVSKLLWRCLDQINRTPLPAEAKDGQAKCFVPATVDQGKHPRYQILPTTTEG
jgi:hypothetical protein